MTRRSQSIADVNSRRSGGANSLATSKFEHGGTVQESEAEIAVYRHALERAREEFQAFAYSVSHDLRAPLRAIEGFSKILLEDFANDLPPEPQRFLKNIVVNTQQLSSQIEDLLRFYRSGKNPPTRISVSADAICKEALTGLDVALLKKASIIQHELPTLLADPLHLREVFSILLENALKATSKQSNPTIEIGAQVEPGATTLYVRDNGIGFDPRNAERLFQVFQKLHTNADFPGNGIGLAIAKRLVEAQGGCVSANSEPGKGATFRFSLPEGHDVIRLDPSCAGQLPVS